LEEFLKEQRRARARRKDYQSVFLWDWMKDCQRVRLRVTQKEKEFLVWGWMKH
jgi:hypothetical protein